MTMAGSERGGIADLPVIVMYDVSDYQTMCHEPRVMNYMSRTICHELVMTRILPQSATSPCMMYPTIKLFVTNYVSRTTGHELYVTN